MFLSLLFRGSSGYTLLHGAREVGSFDGAVLRFHPFATEADAARAADAGYRALVHWLSSRSEPLEGGTVLSAAPPDDATATRWVGPHGTAIARVSRHWPHRSSESYDAARAPYAADFILPSGIYPAVALQPAQRIHEAIIATLNETAHAAAANAAGRPGEAFGHGSTPA